MAKKSSRARAGRDRTAPASTASDGVGKLLGLVLLAGGVIGLVAAVVLLVEKIELIKNPDYAPSCDINPLLACGTVMITWQAEAFGLPNPVLGIIGFAIILTIGVASLGSVAFPQWFWLGVQAGLTFAVLFIHWLVYQSLYVIESLCPYCMVVWVVTIMTFWYVTVHNLQTYTGARGRQPASAVELITRFRVVILFAWYLIIVLLIGHRFWDYWSTLF